jgi:transposase
MELIEILKYVAGEESAIQFLIGKGILLTFKECPFCKGKKIWRVRRQKYKCGSCKKEWGIRYGSILEGFKVPIRTFVLALKLFELEISALKASKQLKVSYFTTLKLYDRFRVSLFKNGVSKVKLASEVEADESYFGGRRKGKRGRGDDYFFFLFVRLGKTISMACLILSMK